AAGAVGVNFHGNPANCHGYTPVCGSTATRLSAGVMRPQPVWYALLLARMLIGERPVHTTLSSPSPPNVDATTLLANDGSLHIVIVDDEPPASNPTAVTLRVDPRRAGASVLPLTAPSPAARSGVALGGEAVASDGSWRDPTRLARVPNRDGTIAIQLPPASAMLVTVAPLHSRR